MFAAGTLSDENEADIRRLALWLDEPRRQLRRALRELGGFEPPLLARAD